MDSHECPATEKACSKCGNTQPITAFYKRSDRDAYFSHCKACYGQTSKRRYQKSRKKVLERQAVRRAEKKDELAAYQADWYKRNREKVLSRCKEYRADPVVREREKKRLAQQYLRDKERRLKRIQERKKDPAVLEKYKQYYRDYYHRTFKKDAAKARAKYANRRAAMLNAMPDWVDQGAIKAVYEEARRVSEETGVMHHVDHIVPLRNKKVCGLHVPANLQILEARKNHRKSNKFG